MAEQTFYTFNLQSGITGLQRALFDAKVEIKEVQTHKNKARITIILHGTTGTINLEEIEVKDHPLARLGRITGVVVNTPEGSDWEDLKPIMVLAFLRGGG